MAGTKEYSAVLLCGGEGNRLRTVTGSSLPKPLLKIVGKELILHTIESLPPTQVTELIFAIKHGADRIKAWVAAQKFSQKITFSEQSGTGVLDAVVASSKQVSTDGLIVCNTDEIRQGIRVKEAIAQHERKNSMVTMVCIIYDQLSRHRLVIADTEGRVLKTELKPKRYTDDVRTRGTIHSGMSIMDRSAPGYFDDATSQDWSGMFDPICKAGKLNAYVDSDVKVYANVGTPQEYRDAVAGLGG